ncbi:hypothetical protein N7520_002781 [Penicillium odoratum]|uniref:uncharacterized protein n=1 Tax=Penicillium odoratum TaxID=1167516 RepID=UPI0025469418|nr:uncharacterized protein N7520_002781 [Penicillium odoratum]KAJ5772252.1 hypothetical protein N7520_002781 [Penicillium odoratum]
MATKIEHKETNFTVFIRLPFPRGDFVDPPPPEWNAAKDRALWEILSRPAKGDDIDWKALADNFNVTLQFLLQQAAWLYDRQLSQVRAQMRRFDPTAQSNPPSPVPGSVSGSAALAGTPMKDVPIIANSGNGRRTSSTSITTINQIRGSRDPSRTDTPTAEGNEQRWDSYGRRPSANRRETQVTSFLRSPPLEEEDLSSSPQESDSEDESNLPAQRFRRFGQYSMHQASLRDDDDDEDDTPAFLPVHRESEQGSRDRPSQELSATLRLDAERAAIARRRIANRSGARMPVASESSASSMSSSAPVAVQGRVPTLGPQRAGEPSRLSPRKSHTSGRETSDGTPSMGSSFSDLDGESALNWADAPYINSRLDASVTQSALEEALMSNMQHGGMASRMSTISQALRSRYLQ